MKKNEKKRRKWDRTQQESVKLQEEIKEQYESESMTIEHKQKEQENKMAAQLFDEQLKNKLDVEYEKLEKDMQGNLVGLKDIGIDQKDNPFMK